MDIHEEMVNEDKLSEVVIDLSVSRSGAIKRKLAWHVWFMG
jgi:hypothetical protein